jgi:hypothetical protein
VMSLPSGLLANIGKAITNLGSQLEACTTQRCTTLPSY